MKISFVIPAYNEETNLPTLIQELIEIIDNKWVYEIVIVNDNSSDSTADIADALSNKYSNIKVIHRNNGGKGIGLSLRKGTKESTGDFIIWLMSDRCDNLGKIYKIINKLNVGYDLVIASRYMKGGSRGKLSLYRTVLSRGYTLICIAIFGLKLHDITNAYRGFRKGVFDNINLEFDGFAITAEFSIKAYLYNYKIGEVSTVHLGRENKRSVVNVLKIGWPYIRLLKLKWL